MHVIPGVHVTRHKVRNQLPTGPFPASGFFLFTIVRYGRKSACTMQGQPGTAGLQVATCKDIGIVRPPVECLRRTAVEFIPIGSEDKSIRGMHLPRENDEAHQNDRRSVIIEPVVNQASGDRQPVGKLGETGLQFLTSEPLGIFEFAVVQSNVP